MRSEVLRAVQAGMQEAAQQPILIKRTVSLAEKSRFRWIKCSSVPRDQLLGNYNRPALGVLKPRTTWRDNVVSSREAAQRIEPTAQAVGRSRVHASPKGAKEVFRATARGSSGFFRPFGAGMWLNVYPRLTPWALYLCAGSRLETTLSPRGLWHETRKDRSFSICFHFHTQQV